MGAVLQYVDIFPALFSFLQTLVKGTSDKIME